MAKSFCPAHVWGDFLQTGGDLKKKSADLSFRGRKFQKNRAKIQIQFEFFRYFFKIVLMVGFEPPPSET
jgi:hypothetical protein